MILDVLGLASEAKSKKSKIILCITKAFWIRQLAYWRVEFMNSYTEGSYATIKVADQKSRSLSTTRRETTWNNSWTIWQGFEEGNTPYHQPYIEKWLFFVRKDLAHFKDILTTKAKEKTNKHKKSSHLAPYEIF